MAVGSIPQRTSRRCVSMRSGEVTCAETRVAREHHPVPATVTQSQIVTVTRSHSGELQCAAVPAQRLQPLSKANESDGRQQQSSSFRNQPHPPVHLHTTLAPPPSLLHPRFSTLASPPSLLQLHVQRNRCNRPKDLFHHILTVGAGKMSIFDRQVASRARRWCAWHGMWL